LTTIYSFSFSDGAFPYAALVQGDTKKGILYGTTVEGGTNSFGTIFQLAPKGAKLVFSNMYNFTGFADGQSPYGALVLGTDGNLYGTTSAGAAGGGTIYQLSTRGTLTTLYSFCQQSGCTDGAVPYGSLFQATNGTFYGATYEGGGAGGGTVYSLSMGLGPFVLTVPQAGLAGTPFTILGSDLSTATAVAFKSTAATFQILSPTAISTIMPSGAKTGPVVVTTPPTSLSTPTSVQVLK
jgi:uncharacterized repeat protein (TIGR03803 family)